MAEVYLAKCFGVAGFERLVALKRILPSIAEDDEFIAMFIDEAKIAGQLSHANVAQIFDLGKINQSYFIAMEYISGHDLRALWDKTREGGGLPLALACYIVQRLCEGLDYAHRRRDNRGRPLGIIHRDVSPQNVLLGYDGDLKVIDFGIAKAANRMVRTQTGILKGKFAYMAPEQARGEPIDHRADIFAIGVILYELLTGERAFKAETDFALLEKVRRVDVVPPRKLRPEVPRDLERIIYKAMSKDAKDRYAWASAMRADLDRFMVDHDLGYNKEELGAFVRRTFKGEHDEEQRRLKLYQGYRVDGAEPAPVVAGRDDAPTSDNATIVKSDPSGDAVAPPPGTEVAFDASTKRPAPPEHTTPQPAAPGANSPESEVPTGEEAFASGNTLAIDAMPRDGRRAGRDEREVDPDTNKDLRRQEARVRRVVSSGDLLPWEEEKAPPAQPPPQTVINVERPVFSSVADPAALDEAHEDATMVDSGPVEESPSEEDPSVALPAMRAPVERRREGTRPEVRGASLSQVLGGTSPALAVLEKERARRGPAENLSAANPRGSSPERRGQGRLETEAFRDPVGPRPPEAPGKLVATAAGAAAIALVVGIAIGALMFSSARTASTFIVVTPGPATVQLGERTLCMKTPCAVDLAAGKHDLMFVKEGLGAVSKTIEVGSGTTVVDVRLQPRLSGLRLQTNPPGAQVWLDGNKLDGVTPLTLPELTAGDKVKLKIALNTDYDVLDELFEVQDTKGAPLTFDLPAKETEFEIRVEPDDAVAFFDETRPRTGRIKETVPRGQTRILSLRRPGCEPKTMTLTGNGKRSDDVPVALACRLFDARVTVTGTRGTEVELDGVPLARRVPVREFPIPAGEHLIIARRRGRQLPFVVDVDPGQTATINAKMR